MKNNLLKFFFKAATLAQLVRQSNGPINHYLNLSLNSLTRAKPYTIQVQKIATTTKHNTRIVQLTKTQARNNYKKANKI